MKQLILAVVVASSALVACNQNDTPAADVRAAAADPSLPTGSAAARAYLAPFISSDVNACFDEVALDTPALEGRAASRPVQSRPPVRVVVLVDGSGSMAGRIGARTKLDLAREAARAFVDGLPTAVEASLLTFGQHGDNSAAGKPRSCAAVDTLVPMTRDRAAIVEGVKGLGAIGWTPLAAGLAKAETSLATSTVPGEQVIYVVSGWPGDVRRGSRRDSQTHQQRTDTRDRQHHRV